MLDEMTAALPANLTERVLEASAASYLVSPAALLSRGKPAEAAAPEQLARMFEFFVQAIPGDGLGIGLALARRLVEMHEGRVGVESMEGVGSIFWFMLPAPPLLVTPAASRVGVESESPA